MHYRNTLKDVGSFQFFGSVVDTDVVENVGERMGGFVSWGQLHGNATFIGPQVSQHRLFGARPFSYEIIYYHLPRQALDKHQTG